MGEEEAFHYAALEIEERRRSEAEEAFAERLHELETMPYEQYLRTPEWAGHAERAKERAGYRCQLCNAAGDLHAHHRTYKCRGYERDGDLTVLCASCHRRHHGTDSPRRTATASVGFVQVRLNR